MNVEGGKSKSDVAPQRDFGRSFAWPEAIYSSNDVDSCRSLLEAALDTRGPQLTAAAFGDLFFQALCLGRKLAWSEECCEKLLDILAELLEYESTNPLCTMAQSFSKFKLLSLLYACERPPWTVGLFEKEQVEAMTQFVMEHHYRHFKLQRFLNDPAAQRIELRAE